MIERVMAFSVAWGCRSSRASALDPGGFHLCHRGLRPLPLLGDTVEQTAFSGHLLFADLSQEQSWVAATVSIWF